MKLWFGGRSGPVFTSPAGGRPKSAVLHGRLRGSAQCRVFDPTDPRLAIRLQAYCPQSLAATLEQLLKLPDEVRPGHSIVAFSETGLDPEARDRLWERFRVPVFEQIRLKDGTLIATECEAHDGLHLVNAGGGPKCACGSTARKYEGRVPRDTDRVQATTPAGEAAPLSADAAVA